MIHYNDHALLLNESYRRWAGNYLVEESDPGAVLGALNEADFALVSHGLESEPLFNYGNVRGLTMLGYELGEFIQLPSRETVPESELTARAELSAQVEASGFVSDYRGLRLAKSGRVWQIDSGVVWQLTDNLGRVHGHAACFKEWHALIDS